MPLSGMKSVPLRGRDVVSVLAMWSPLCEGGRAPQLRDGLVGAGLEEAADDLGDLGDRLGPVQDRLIVGDVVVDAAHLDDVERAVLHRAELLDLPVAGEDPRAVRAQLAVLDDDTEL